MSNLVLRSSEHTFEDNNESAKSLTLSECLERNLLVSPDSMSSLVATEVVLTDGVNRYHFYQDSPILYPKKVSDAWVNGTIPLENQDDPMLQYVLLSQIKQSGEINAPLDSLPAKKHRWRFHEFCSGLKGVVLDIGCDKPSSSMLLLPQRVQYIGLDPYAGSGEFRIIGLGEVLPIASASVNAVLFNTSLDHILDYHTAINESHRVLKSEGQIIIATYAWKERASLLTDSVHFHHFREYEVLGALEEKFRIDRIVRYEDPKLDTHRYGLYIQATKL